MGQSGGLRIANSHSPLSQLAESSLQSGVTTRNKSISPQSGALSCRKKSLQMTGAHTPVACLAQKAVCLQLAAGPKSGAIFCYRGWRSATRNQMQSQYHEDLCANTSCGAGGQMSQYCCIRLPSSAFWQAAACLTACLCQQGHFCPADSTGSVVWVPVCQPPAEWSCSLYWLCIHAVA